MPKPAAQVPLQCILVCFWKGLGQAKRIWKQRASCKGKHWSGWLPKIKAASFSDTKGKGNVLFSGKVFDPGLLGWLWVGQKPEKFQAKPTYPPLEVKNARIQRITMFTRLTCWNWSWKCRTDLLTLQETSQETHLRFKFLFESEPSKIDRNPNASTRSTHVPQGKEKNCSRKVFGKKLFKRFLTKK